MKKLVSFSLVLFVLLNFVSCRVKTNYDFMHSKDSVVSVEIVLITINEVDGLQQKVQTIVEEPELFLNEFSQVKCYVWFSDPIGVKNNVLAVKIIYDNGDYELIQWNGQAKYERERGLRNYTGFRVFDENEFNALLDNFLT